MEIRELEKKEVKLAKQLWEEVFMEDRGAYADWFFQNVFRPERCSGVFGDGGELLSMATRADYQIWIRGRAFESNFVQGVATRPAEQGRGYSSALQIYLLHKLFKEGQAVAALTTFIHPFYEKFGYGTYVFGGEESIPAGNGGGYLSYSRAAAVSEALMEKLAALYGQSMAGRSGWVIRDAAYYRRYLIDCLDQSGYLLLVAGDEAEPGGYAIVKKQPDRLLATELVMGTARPADFAGAAADLGLPSFVWRTFEGDRPEAMLRVVNVKKFVEKLRLGDGECVFAIEDPFIEANTGSWHFFSENGRVKATPTRADALIRLSIGGFAQLAMGVESPLSGPEESIRRVRQVFFPCERRLFEAY